MCVYSIDLSLRTAKFTLQLQSNIGYEVRGLAEAVCGSECRAEVAVGPFQFGDVCRPSSTRFAGVRCPREYRTGSFRPFEGPATGLGTLSGTPGFSARLFGTPGRENLSGIGGSHHHCGGPSGDVYICWSIRGRERTLE